ncbi:thioredoxin domain-containing protein [Sulfuriroseicoccus oceanibius]|uniref:Thioredoxin domain-containing protein n=1 Tax=Sulfuriroseicoccus oceanibius TaxID=2707525 RepID=A0A6B3L5H6_9BACT|nr:thioredoxin domain-containing protein [Sulfuriroseicoccus oceanibius]QQL45070.1 thioredoxin domain-containing protein [Sulfuriroseicoccus oceanibius]
MSDAPHTNRLATETSPYLQQHATNPVDWLPWGDEALEKAKRENKPIFLSIGYSTCHWCHVMARESFANAQTAKLMNQHFVNIKVDREERPDVDSIYMTYVQATTGRGGWPMSVFLTPEGTPFVGGTYFPPQDSQGRPGFPRILSSIAEMWEKDAEKVRTSAEDTMRQIQQILLAPSDDKSPLTAAQVDASFDTFATQYDQQHGGFGSYQKFPRPVALEFLLNEAVRSGVDSGKGARAMSMVTGTLDAIATGGITDHLGGGIHRYTVDEIWHVPHFEKMLYDQALVVPPMVATFQLTGNPRYADHARATLDYVLRDMTHEDGGFFSAEDAESPLPENPSEKGEGAFYTWSHIEIDELLTLEQARVFNAALGIERGGNVNPASDPHNELRGLNVPFLANPPQTDADRQLLSEALEIITKARNERPRPHLDDKVLTSWNGLMIAALAGAAHPLGDNRYLAAAHKAAAFIKANLYDPSGKTLIRSWRNGQPSSTRGFADDYAFLIHGLIELYQADFDTQWLEWAIDLQQTQIALFHDAKHGGFFNTEATDEKLILRMKNDTDNAEPSAGSLSALNLQRLAAMLDHEEWGDIAEETIASFTKNLTQAPSAAPLMAVALAHQIDGLQTVVLAAADGADAMAAAVRDQFLPGTTTIQIPDAEGSSARRFFTTRSERYAAMHSTNGTATAFLCRGKTCEPPITCTDELKAKLAPAT